MFCFSTNWISKKKKYSPIAATHYNLFFIENSLKKYVIKNRNYEINDLIENNNKNFIFTTYDGNIFTSQKVALPWHGITVEKINYLPEFLKQFPGNYNIFQRKMLRIFRFYQSLSKILNLKNWVDTTTITYRTFCSNLKSIKYLRLTNFLDTKWKK
jgi:hypothetical protein